MSEAYLLGVTDARTYFKREGVTVAAFVAPDGRHVLLELDIVRNQVGLIDPTNYRSWVYAKRIHDCWPLRPLGGHHPTEPVAVRVMREARETETAENRAFFGSVFQSSDPAPKGWRSAPTGAEPDRIERVAQSSEPTAAGGSAT